MTYRRLELDDEKAKMWMELVESRTGIVIPQDRKPFLAYGLRARMMELGLDNYDVYYRMLHTGNGNSREWSQLIDRLTVHETSFFRHPPSLQLLTERVLPEYCQRDSDGERAFQVWSLGCATGEEPYSLAMLIQEGFGSCPAGRRYGVVATDISQPSLRAARAGVYGERGLRGIPVRLRKKYCRELSAGKWQVSPELRRRVYFAQLNVHQMNEFPLWDLDLIYCQNMLIYFPRPKRLQITESLVQRLAPGGVLILGPGDLPCWSHPGYSRIRFEGTLAFQRQAAEAASA